MNGDPSINGDTAGNRRMLMVVALWGLALIVAGSLDSTVARWMRESGVEHFLHTHTLLREIVKAPGYYRYTLIIVAVVAWMHPLRWRAGGFVLIAAIVSGSNGIVKRVVGRTRPFKLDELGQQLEPFTLQPFRGGWAEIFNNKNLCFPSGHACLAFATATALVMLWPRARWRYLAYIGAGMVACERFAENAHWLSDTVAAAALGIGGTKLTAWGLGKITASGSNQHLPALGEP